jgi:hypothetical protein
MVLKRLVEEYFDNRSNSILQAYKQVSLWCNRLQKILIESNVKC